MIRLILGDWLARYRKEVIAFCDVVCAVRSTCVHFRQDCSGNHGFVRLLIGSFLVLVIILYIVSVRNVVLDFYPDALDGSSNPGIRHQTVLPHHRISASPYINARNVVSNGNLI